MNHFIAQHYEYIIWGILVGLIVMVGWGVFKTFKEEAVFFYNYWDLFANLAILIVFLCGYFNHQKEWSVYLLIISPIIAVIYNYFMGFKFNGSFLGLCIGTGRIVLGYLIPLLMVLFTVLGSPDRRTGESQNAYHLRRGIEKMERLALIGGLMFFLSKLVGHTRRSTMQKSLDLDKTVVPKEFPEQSIPKRVEEKALESRGDNSQQKLLSESEEEIIRMALNVPEVLPCEFDQTVQFWLARIKFWCRKEKPQMNILYTDPAGHRRKVEVEDFEKAMTEPEELIQLFGKWTMNKKSYKSFEAFREFYDAKGKRRREAYFVDLILDKDIENGFKGKF